MTRSPSSVYERSLLESVVIAAQLEEVRVGFSMPSRHYVPQVDVACRNEHYVAVESRHVERVVAIEQTVKLPEAPQPTPIPCIF